MRGVAGKDGTAKTPPAPPSPPARPPAGPRKPKAASPSGVVARHKLDRQRVDAVPLVGGRLEALAREHVPQVALAAGADNLHAALAKRHILVRVHRPRDEVVECRPPCSSGSGEVWAGAGGVGGGGLGGGGETHSQQQERSGSSPQPLSNLVCAVYSGWPQPRLRTCR